MIIEGTVQFTSPDELTPTCQQQVLCLRAVSRLFCNLAGALFAKVVQAKPIKVTRQDLMMLQRLTCYNAVICKKMTALTVSTVFPLPQMFLLVNKEGDANINTPAGIKAMRDYDLLAWSQRRFNKRVLGLLVALFNRLPNLKQVVVGCHSSEYTLKENKDLGALICAYINIRFEKDKFQWYAWRSNNVACTVLNALARSCSKPTCLELWPIHLEGKDLDEEYLEDLNALPSITTLSLSTFDMGFYAEEFLLEQNADDMQDPIKNMLTLMAIFPSLQNLSLDFLGTGTSESPGI